MSQLFPVARHVWFFVCAFCYGKIQKESLAAPCIKTALPTGGKETKKRKYMLGASREEGKEGEKFGWKDHERVVCESWERITGLQSQGFIRKGKYAEATWLKLFIHTSV